MADNEDEQGPEQEEAEEVEKQEEQGVQEEVEEEEQSEEGEAADNDDESDKFVSGVKESPELVEESLRSEYYSGISEKDRENLTAVGTSAQERKRGSTS